MKNIFRGRHVDVHRTYQSHQQQQTNRRIANPLHPGQQPSYPNGSQTSNISVLQQQQQRGMVSGHVNTNVNQGINGPGLQQQSSQQLETLVQKQLLGGTTHQQQQLRLKLESWARSKGHAGLTDLLSHQQRLNQQRIAQQQHQSGNVSFVSPDIASHDIPFLFPKVTFDHPQWVLHRVPIFIIIHTLHTTIYQTT